MSDEQKPWGPRERQRYVEEVLLKQQAPSVDLMPEDLPALLTCETRMTQQTSWYGKWWRQEVLYRGHWLGVGHTSLLDDVRTSFAAPTAEAQGLLVADLVTRSFGARLSETCISFITHMTDG